MPTHQKTDSTNKYDPGSMGAFQGLTSGFAKTTGDYMNNPFGNPFMQTQQQMGTRQAQNMGQTGMSNISRNITGSGMGGGNMSPAALEMMQNQGRANSGMQSQLGFLGPMQNAQGMQQNAMQMAGNYRPLQTGGTQTQSTGGLGTWLPQVAGAALGGLTGLGAMGGAGGFFSGAGAHPGGFSQPSGGGGGFGGGMGGPDLGMPAFMGGMQPPGGGGGDWGGGSSVGGMQPQSWWQGGGF